MRFVFVILGFMLITGCYRAGGEEDLCGVPVTNNPHITPQTDSRPFPGLPY